MALYINGSLGLYYRGEITPFITSRGSPCMVYGLYIRNLDIQSYLLTKPVLGGNFGGTRHTSLPGILMSIGKSSRDV